MKRAVLYAPLLAHGQQVRFKAERRCALRAAGTVSLSWMKPIRSSKVVIIEASIAQPGGVGYDQGRSW